MFRYSSEWGFLTVAGSLSYNTAAIFAFFFLCLVFLFAHFIMASPQCVAECFRMENSGLYNAFDGFVVVHLYFTGYQTQETILVAIFEPLEYSCSSVLVFRNICCWLRCRSLAVFRRSDIADYGWERFYELEPLCSSFHGVIALPYGLSVDHPPIFSGLFTLFCRHYPLHYLMTVFIKLQEVESWFIG